MKKNKMMRFASMVLVLTLLSTCAISGTFAKYTTTASGTDTARVAYWGFGSSGTDLDMDLFAASYVTSGSENVKSSGSDNVVAPGTSGTATFSFVTASDATKAPEVAYTFTVDATGTCGTNLVNELEFTLDGAKVGTNGTFSELLTAIEALAGTNATNGVATYAPGELPTAFSNNTTHTIGWTWEFNGNDDAADTTLGNAGSETVTLTISVIAEQID